MKTFNYKLSKYSFSVFLFFLICSSTAFGYGQQLKPQRSDINYSRIITLKTGMTKEEVKSILGEPYKISFTTNEKQEFVENLFYKSQIFIHKRYEITYQCVFINSKLASLLEKETLFDKEKIVLTKVIP